MQKLSTLEKKEIFGGFAGKVATSSSKAIKKVPSQLDSKFHWFTNNSALIALATVPWLISFGEGIYSLIAKKPSSYSNYSGGRSYEGAGGGFNYMDSRRSFYAYASEAFRPMMRFSPMPYKNGITFGMPWLV